MARRRYISTDMSTDERLNQLATEAGDFALNLYILMIPHAEDTAEIVGTATEIMYRVVPGRRDKTVDDVTSALAAMVGLGLISWDATKVSFPDSFYKHQSYIKEERRRRSEPQRTSAQNAEDPRTAAMSAQNAASVSVLFSVPKDKDAALAASYTGRLRQQLTTDHGKSFQPQETLYLSTREILDTALRVMPEDEHHSIAMGLICDYVEAVQEKKIPTAARSHLARLVKRNQPLAALHAIDQALVAGAAIGEDYADDPRALTKYATAVLTQQRSAK